MSSHIWVGGRGLFRSQKGDAPYYDGPTTERDSWSSNKICPFYQKGNCKFEDKCRDMHKGDPPSSGHVRERDSWSSKKICPFYQNGHCKFEDKCRDMHKGDRPSSGHMTERDSWSSKKICSFYQNGHCKFEDKCRDLHKGGFDDARDHGPVKGKDSESSKRRVCLFYEKGHCKFEDNCRDMHIHMPQQESGDFGPDSRDFLPGGKNYWEKLPPVPEKKEKKERPFVPRDRKRLMNRLKFLKRDQRNRKNLTDKESKDLEDRIQDTIKRLNEFRTLEESGKNPWLTKQGKVMTGRMDTQSELTKQGKVMSDQMDTTSKEHPEEVKDRTEPEPCYEDAETSKAVAEGLVKMGSKGMYVCTSCETPIISMKSLKIHYNSEKHKQKMGEKKDTKKKGEKQDESVKADDYHEAMETEVTTTEGENSHFAQADESGVTTTQTQLDAILPTPTAWKLKAASSIAAAADVTKLSRSCDDKMVYDSSRHTMGKREKQENLVQVEEIGSTATEELPIIAEAGEFGDDAETNSALSEGLIKMGRRGMYVCTLCETPIISFKSMRIHYRSEKHLERYKKEHPEEFKDNTEPEPYDEDAEASKAVAEGLVKMGGKGMYVCTFCETPIISMKSLKIHYNSEKHKQKMNQLYPPQEATGIHPSYYEQPQFQTALEYQQYQQALQHYQYYQQYQQTSEQQYQQTSDHQYQHTTDQQYQHTPDQQYQQTPDRQYQQTPDQQYQQTPDQQYQQTPDQQYQHTPEQQYQHTSDQQYHQTSDQQYQQTPDQQYQQTTEQQYSQTPYQQYQQQPHQQYVHPPYQQYQDPSQQQQYQTYQQYQQPPPPPQQPPQQQGQSIKGADGADRRFDFSHQVKGTEEFQIKEEPSSGNQTKKLDFKKDFHF